MHEQIDPVQFEKLARDVADIKRAVVGDPSYRHEGLLGRVEKLEGAQRRSHLNAAGTSGLVAGVVLAVKWFFTKGS